MREQQRALDSIRQRSSSSEIHAHSQQQDRSSSTAAATAISSGGSSVTSVAASMQQLLADRLASWTMVRRVALMVLNMHPLHSVYYQYYHCMMCNPIYTLNIMLKLPSSQNTS